MKNKILIALALLATVGYSQTWPKKGMGVVPVALSKGSRMKCLTTRVYLPAAIGSAVADSAVVFRALVPGIVQNFIVKFDTAMTDTGRPAGTGEGYDSLIIRKSSWGGALTKLGAITTKRILTPAGKGDSLRLEYPVLIQGTDTCSNRRVAANDMIWFKVQGVGLTTTALSNATLQFEFYPGDFE